MFLTVSFYELHGFVIVMILVDVFFFQLGKGKQVESSRF